MHTSHTVAIDPDNPAALGAVDLHDKARVVITHTPTITDDGTLDESDLVPAVGKHNGVSDGGVEAEYILKPEVNRLLRITNNKGGGGSSDIALRLFFYEG